MFPIHLNLGSRILPFYESLYFLIAIVLGYVVAVKRLKKEGLWESKMDNMILIGLLSALVGARVSHFLFWDLQSFIRNPLIAFRPFIGGASIVGGILFGFLGAFIACRIYRFDSPRVFAVLSPALLLAQAVGRIGCFLNGDAFGVATQLPWGVRFRRYGATIPGFRELRSYSSSAWLYSVRNGLVTDPNSTWSAPLHPTQIYEILADLALLALVLFLYRKIKKTGGRYRMIFFVCTGGYSLARGFLEFIRADRQQVIGGAISLLQIFLFAYFAFSLVMIAMDLGKLRASPANSARG